MKRKLRHNGFSLVEVLMAVGILTVAMLLVATMFPLGIHFTTVSVERTMAAIVADEAFAKVQLFGIDTGFLNTAGSTDTLPLALYLNLPFDVNEFAYPSIDPTTEKKQYYWAGLCRKISADSNNIQITIFAARKKANSNTYSTKVYPIFFQTSVVASSGSDEITQGGLEGFINPPTTIAEVTTGRLFRVVKRVGLKLTLDREWDADLPNSTTIVFLRPADGTGGYTTAIGGNPDIGVFQRILKF